MEQTFFSRYRYDVTSQYAAFYPDYYLRLVVNILLLVFVGFISLGIISIVGLNFAINGMQGIKDYPAVGYLGMIGLFLIPLVLKMGFSILYNAKIVFDVDNKTISKHSIWGSKQLAEFSEVAKIFRETGYHLRLHNGQIIRLTAAFHTYDAHVYFQNNVLPEVEKMLVGLYQPSRQKPIIVQPQHSTTNIQTAAMKAENETVIKFSRKKTFKLLCMGIALTVVWGTLTGIVIYLKLSVFHSHHRGALGGALLLLICAGFGLVIIFGTIKSLFDKKKSGLILNSKGLLFNGTPIGKKTGFILWDDIASISTGFMFVDSILTGQFVFLHPKDKEKYIRRLPTNLMQTKVDEYGIPISNSDLSIGFDELKELITNYFNQYKKDMTEFG
jgi:hypothetical protein